MLALDVNQMIYVPLKVKKLKTGIDEGDAETADEITFYILLSVCQDPQALEFAYTDEVIFECESKISTAEHLDQREKQIEIKLKDPEEPEKANDAVNQDLMVPDQQQGATMRANVRFCYSRLKFLQSLQADIDALILKEREYMDYLEGIMSSINFIVVRTQAIIRGWLARRRVKALRKNKLKIWEAL